MSNSKQSASSPLSLGNVAEHPLTAREGRESKHESEVTIWIGSSKHVLRRAEEAGRLLPCVRRALDTPTGELRWPAHTELRRNFGRFERALHHVMDGMLDATPYVPDGRLTSALNWDCIGVLVAHAPLAMLQVMARPYSRKYSVTRLASDPACRLPLWFSTCFHLAGAEQAVARLGVLLTELQLTPAGAAIVHAAVREAGLDASHLGGSADQSFEAALQAVCQEGLTLPSSSNALLLTLDILCGTACLPALQTLAPVLSGLFGAHEVSGQTVAYSSQTAFGMWEATYISAVLHSGQPPFAFLQAMGETWTYSSVHANWMTPECILLNVVEVGSAQGVRAAVEEFGGGLKPSAHYSERLLRAACFTGSIEAIDTLVAAGLIIPPDPSAFLHTGSTISPQIINLCEAARSGCIDMLQRTAAEFDAAVQGAKDQGDGWGHGRHPHQSEMEWRCAQALASVLKGGHVDCAQLLFEKARQVLPPLALVSLAVWQGCLEGGHPAALAWFDDVLLPAAAAAATAGGPHHSAFFPRPAVDTLARSLEGCAAECVTPQSFFFLLRHVAQPVRELGGQAVTTQQLRLWLGTLAPAVFRSPHADVARCVVALFTEPCSQLALSLEDHGTEGQVLLSRMIPLLPDVRLTTLPVLLELLTALRPFSVHCAPEKSLMHMMRSAIARFVGGSCLDEHPKLLPSARERWRALIRFLSERWADDAVQRSTASEEKLIQAGLKAALAGTLPVTAVDCLNPAGQPVWPTVCFGQALLDDATGHMRLQESALEQRVHEIELSFAEGKVTSPVYVEEARARLAAYRQGAGCALTAVLRHPAEGGPLDLDISSTLRAAMGDATWSGGHGLHDRRSLVLLRHAQHND